MSLPSTLNQEPFVWRGLTFRWSHQRAAWVAGLALLRPLQLDHWLYVQSVSGQFRAWVEFHDTYTETCTMKIRQDALDGALHALIDHCMLVIKRLGELPPP